MLKSITNGVFKFLLKKHESDVNRFVSDEEESEIVSLVSCHWTLFHNAAFHTNGTKALLMGYVHIMAVWWFKKGYLAVIMDSIAVSAAATPAGQLSCSI